MVRVKGVFDAEGEDHELFVFGAEVAEGGDWIADEGKEEAAKGIESERSKDGSTKQRRDDRQATMAD